jgi:hypothetical protein
MTDPKRIRHLDGLINGREYQRVARPPVHGHDPVRAANVIAVAASSPHLQQGRQGQRGHDRQRCGTGPPA